MNKSSKWLIVIAGLVIAGCVCVSVLFIGGAGLVLINQPSQVSTPSVVGEEPSLPGPTQENNPTAVLPLESPTPAINPTPPDDAAKGTIDALESTIVHANNPISLAERLKGKQNIQPTVPAPAKPYQVGDTLKFWVLNSDTDQNRQVTATLRYSTDHLYFWIDNGVQYSPSALKKLSDTFESEIYPTDRKFFGSEWTPGVDGDAHLYVLYVRSVGRSTAGYFSSADEIPPEAFPYSNAHEMFIISADHYLLSDDYVYATMAHEFQHMIHFNLDRNEDAWMNEGFSVLAEKLNGYQGGGFDQLFANNPDMQLNFWPDHGSSAPYYGASFLFLDYFLGRFGSQATQALVANPLHSLDSVDAVLHDLKETDPATGKQLSADDVFADWAVANYLNDKNVAGGLYYYQDYPQAPTVSPDVEITDCPSQGTGSSVSQYGAVYLKITCSGKHTIQFDGSSQVQLVPADPASGQFMFWSNRADDSDMNLTREFDFSQVSGALQMTYQAWFDLETGYDYLYLEASEDGKNWEILKTPSGTDSNPVGQNFSWGYTGTSNGNWVQENVDLSKFAGKKVQLRFEYVTDAEVNKEGFLLDDVSIPAINYQADFEKDGGGWSGDGFVRVANRLPQSFKVTAILVGNNTRVAPVQLNDLQQGSLDLDIGGDTQEVILVVSGTTRFTTQRAGFSVSLR